MMPSPIDLQHQKTGFRFYAKIGSKSSDVYFPYVLFRVGMASATQHYASDLVSMRTKAYFVSSAVSKINRRS